jgi:hypothetical protein
VDESQNSLGATLVSGMTILSTKMAEQETILTISKMDATHSKLTFKAMIEPPRPQKSLLETKLDQEKREMFSPQPSNHRNSGLFCP